MAEHHDHDDHGHDDHEHHDHSHHQAPWVVVVTCAACLGFAAFLVIMRTIIHG